MRLRVDAWPEVYRGNPQSGKACDIRPRLLRLHRHDAAGRQRLHEGVLTEGESGRRLVDEHHFAFGARELDQVRLGLLERAIGPKAVVYVHLEKIRNDVSRAASFGERRAGYRRPLEPVDLAPLGRKRGEAGQKWRGLVNRVFALP